MVGVGWCVLLEEESKREKDFVATTKLKKPMHIQAISGVRPLQPPSQFSLLVLLVKPPLPALLMAQLTAFMCITSNVLKIFSFFGAQRAGLACARESRKDKKDGEGGYFHGVECGGWLHCGRL